MDGQKIAILESRLGEQLADVIAKRGGTPVRAPALAEIPDVDPPYIEELIREWRSRPVAAAIFQTGVGTHALFKTCDSLGLTETLLKLLEATKVVVRGPKPTAALRSRGVRIDLSAEEPYTTVEVLAAIDTLSLQGSRVVVQRYGAKNPELEHGLQAKGAEVIEIPTYRWAMPADTTPLAELLVGLERREIQCVVFTSASQVHNLFEFARTQAKADALPAHLNATLIASIGPVSSATLAQFGVKVALEAHPPKLGPLVAALDLALSKPV